MSSVATSYLSGNVTKRMGTQQVCRTHAHTAARNVAPHHVKLFLLIPRSGSCAVRLRTLSKIAENAEQQASQACRGEWAHPNLFVFTVLCHSRCWQQHHESIQRDAKKLPQEPQRKPSRCAQRRHMKSRMHGCLADPPRPSWHQLRSNDTMAFVLTGLRPAAFGQTYSLGLQSNSACLRPNTVPEHANRELLWISAGVEWHDLCASSAGCSSVTDFVRSVRARTRNSIQNGVRKYQTSCCQAFVFETMPVQEQGLTLRQTAILHLQ